MHRSCVSESFVLEQPQSLLIVEVDLGTADGGYHRRTLGAEGFLFVRFIPGGQLSGVAVRYVVFKTRHDVFGGDAAHLVLFFWTQLVPEGDEKGKRREAG